MTEFELIKHYFATQTDNRTDVSCGIGDDAAVVSIAPDQELAITTDTLIAGLHFLEATLPYDIGYKALAVNLSDLAAMGATPNWFMLALTLPEANEDWIQEFCQGIFTLANRYQVQLIGGDLTRGSLSMTIQAMGVVPKNKAILRSGAKVADLIYVTGHLGDAALALQYLQKKVDVASIYHRSLLEHLHRPEPRIATGEHLRGLASAAIDISDGFAADLGHILEASNVGALILVDKLPLSEALTHTLPLEDAIQLALTGGDEYELCFTIAPVLQAQVEKILSAIQCPFTCVGQITNQKGLDLRYQNGNKYNGAIFGFQHF